LKNFGRTQNLITSVWAEGTICTLRSFKSNVRALYWRVAPIDKDHKRLLERPVESDTKIVYTKYVRVGEIPLLVEKWRADGVIGMTAVFLSEHATEMDDSALQRFLTEQAGLDIGRSVTIVRREHHSFFNFGFEIK